MDRSVSFSLGNRRIFGLVRTSCYAITALAAFILIWLHSPLAFAGAKTIGPTKDYTRDQKIRRGEVTPHKMTTCRLKRRVKARNGQQVCVYIGAQQTYEMQVESWCPKQYQCRFNPGQEEPNIDDVIESLNKIKK